MQYASVTGKYSLISFSSHRARIHFSPQRRVSCRVTSCTTAVQSWTVGISIIGWHVVVYRCVPLNTSPLSHLFHRYAKFERIAFDLLPRFRTCKDIAWGRTNSFGVFVRNNNKNYLDYHRMLRFIFNPRFFRSDEVATRDDFFVSNNVK